MANRGRAPRRQNPGAPTTKGQIRERARKAATVSLASYTIRIRQKRETTYELLGRFDGKSGFLDFFEGYASALSQGVNHDEEHLSLHRIRDLERSGSIISGVLESGAYGVSADLISAATLARSYLRQIDDAELLPFYFLLDAPAKTDKALLLLQRISNLGVMTTFGSGLRREFDNRFPDYTLDINRHVPAEVLDSLRNGIVKQIEMTRYEMSDDLADEVGWKGNRGQVGQVVITVKARRKGALAKPKWLEGLLKTDMSSLVEIPEMLNADRVRVSLTYLGKQRMIDLQRADQIAPYLDITSDVEIGLDGHPTLPSIKRAFAEVHAKLREEVGGGE
jgi:hypothetical protein